ncbi:MAG: 1,4-alpha-glucan branching protein GlgB [Thermoleophilia bacterium]
MLSDEDVHLFNEGRHFRLYRKLGAHPLEARGVAGTYFAVWAPNAEHVSVIGDFNGWDGARHPLRARGQSGLWEGFVPGVGTGATYKYRLHPRDGGPPLDKADPFAFAAEEPPRTASVVCDLDRAWSDRDWLRERGDRQRVDRPISIYEVHLGSWRRVPEEGDRWLTYRELAPLLADHALAHGFTHVELLPVMEHPFYGSWGYQVTGYFAPTARYGRPEDLMAMIEHLHQRGVGVILDWVPSHFPADPHGLAAFDGTFLYEHEDPRQRVHPDWQSWIFNYGRNEVRSFLVSNALFWLDRYHADGLRIDAVASMLYLDYSRREGEWVPNRFGGRENLEALELLRTLNEEVYATFPDTMTIAEESTAWPAVSRPVYAGGLGFGFKWDMGWMHDTLAYFGRDPVHRRYHQEDLTFRGLYAWTENFVLPLSHDEVVHGKGSLLGRMPGDAWQQRANLRALYGLMTGTPGKKLLFMGAELAQPGEWQHEASLDWHLLEDEGHAGVSRWVARLNGLYRDEPALHELDADPAGFAWIDCTDREHSVFAFERRGRDCEPVAVVANLTPVPRHDYRVGLPRPGRWTVLASSDAAEFGGSGHGVDQVIETQPIPWHGREQSAAVTLPPLGVLFLRRET